MSLADLVPPDKKKLAPKTRRAPELAAWDMKPSKELVELVKLHDAGKLAYVGEYWPFHFSNAFFAAPKKRERPFEEYLRHAQLFGWPAYFLAHFAGLQPIGATGAGDHWLARVTPDEGGTSRVYLYRHETGELLLAFRSIAALFDAADVDGIDVFGMAPAKAKRLPPADDPIALWERASWAADALGANALDGWKETIARAPTLATFAKEAKVLAKRPDLAAYWLLAHALLGNVEAFEVVEKATAKAKNPFVAELRVRAASLLRGKTLEDFTLGKLPGAEVASRLEAIRGAAPKAVRKGTPPALPARPPAISVEEVTKLAKKGALLAFMTKHPDREKLHAWALAHIGLWGKADKGPVEVLERIADFGLTKAHLAEMPTWLSIEPLVSDDGRREAALVDLLVARKSKRAAEIVLRTLALIEKRYFRLQLVARVVTLAAELDPARAKPILTRMAADKTWARYDKEVMPHLRRALG